jgi:hypothetical protein
MKHYVVIAKNPTVPQQNAIMNLVKANFGYWHWISNVWLLADAIGSDSAGSVRDKIRNVVPGCHFTVLEVHPVDWAGYSDTRWWEWLHENWRPY